MSLPSFPDKNQLPSREEAINQIISSIAMEELGLSHIINAEGEKLQYALGTIPETDGPEDPLTMDQLLELNESIQKTLDSTMMNQFFLKEKLLGALSAAVLQGPAGPTGPQGPATIDVDSEVIRLGPEASPTVENVGPSEQEAVLKFGIPRGVTGADGTSPTVEVGSTETIEPGLSADVSAAPTTTGIELSFRIPRGVTGAAEVSGIQAVLNNEAGTEVEVLQDGVIPFNQVLSSSGTDISYDSDTSVFTVNTTGLNNIYMINWWIFAEGSDIAGPLALALNVGGTSHLTTVSWVETQLSGTTLAVAGEDSIQVSLTNASRGSINLSNVSVQAQITIIGFSRAN